MIPADELGLFDPVMFGIEDPDSLGSSLENKYALALAENQRLKIELDESSMQYAMIAELKAVRYV